jgi:hypothetical protein
LVTARAQRGHAVVMALTDFQKNVNLRLMSGEQPEA